MALHTSAWLARGWRRSHETRRIQTRTTLGTAPLPGPPSTVNVGSTEDIPEMVYTQGLGKEARYFSGVGHTFPS